MGKVSRERDADVAREAIIEAAECAFARKGFNGARIDSIAEQAEYNKSLIFHYFGDKEGLYRAVVAKMKNRLENDFLQPLIFFIQNSGELNAERVRSFIELAVGRYFDFMVEYPRSLGILAWEAAEKWQTFIEISKQTPEISQHKKSMGAVAAFFERAKAAGLIYPTLDPTMLFMNVGGTCIMYLLTAPRNENLYGENFSCAPEKLTRARQQIIELVLYGVMLSSPKEIS